ncbi:MAG: SDR family oxidoreductase [Halobacteriales archaeon]
MTERSLTGRKAIVTGASAGIGRETVRQLAAEGADVALAARRTDRLERLATEIEDEHGIEAPVVPTDVTEPNEVETLIDTAAEQFGQIDVVVANAGIGRSDPVAELSTEDYRAMMAVNVDGAFFTARAAIPHLEDTSGTLIFVGSFAGQYPRPGNPVYAATKWWLRGFALSLAGQIGEDGISVSVVNPTEVRTEFGDPDADPMKESYAPGSVTEPEEVAEAIAYAAGEGPPNSVTELNLYRRDKFEHF